jgi:hypothetical protein
VSGPHKGNDLGDRHRIIDRHRDTLLGTFPLDAGGNVILGSKAETAPGRDPPADSQAGGLLEAR